MVTLYHLNHSCKNCMPGSEFKLVPIQIANGSNYTAVYEKWKQDFPDGLSVFGYRHMTPEQPFGSVSSEKAILEAACELVRRSYFPHIMSRYQAFFCVATIQEAIGFRDATKVKTGGTIWEIEAKRCFHRGDMRWLDPEHYTEESLRSYWDGQPFDEGTPIWECLVSLPVKMVRCILHEDEV